MKVRMPPLEMSTLNEAQRKAADALIAGPRKGVFGPFIPLLRSPDLMDRLQRVGEYLRFNSVIPPKLGEFATLVTARHGSNQFEWAVHHPLAVKAGVARETVDAVGQGRRPTTMAADEALVYDFVVELLANKGVCDASYAAMVSAHGEQGVIDLVSLVGYFGLIDLVMNVAHSPAPAETTVAPLPALPL